MFLHRTASSTLWARCRLPRSRCSRAAPTPACARSCARSQRGRLICAIADAVAAKGYAATSVADVIALAGVSRKTFYEHFGDKEACFLAAYDSGAQAIYDAMVEAIDGLSRWEDILASVLTTSAWARVPAGRSRVHPRDRPAGTRATSSAPR